MRHPGTIGSDTGIRIRQHMIPPRTVRRSQPHPPIDFLNGYGSHVDPPPSPRGYSVLSPVLRSFHISNTSINRSSKRSLIGSAPACMVKKKQSRWLIAGWFELYSAVLCGWRAFSVGHREYRVPSPIHDSPNLYSSDNAGTITMTSRVDTATQDVELPNIHATRSLAGARTQVQRHHGQILSPVPVSAILTNRGRYAIAPTGKHSPARWCDNNLSFTLASR